MQEKHVFITHCCDGNLWNFRVFHHKILWRKKIQKILWGPMTTRKSCGGLRKTFYEGSCGGISTLAEVLRRCLAEVLRSFSQVLRRCLAELRKTSARFLRSSARVLRRSCGGPFGGPCGGLAEFIETLRRPPQDFKLLHYVVIGPVYSY